MLVQNYIIESEFSNFKVWSYREKDHQRKRSSGKDTTIAQDFRSGHSKLILEIGLFSVKALLSVRAQSDRVEGHIATGKTSAADISDSCLSKQKMLPHSGQQHALTTSITSEINELPSSGNSSDLCSFYHLHTAHFQQLQLSPLKHFPCQLNNLSLLFCCSFCSRKKT